MTELVSRVLYIQSMRQSSIFTARYRTVQANGSATTEIQTGRLLLRDSKVLLRIGFTASLRYRKLG